MKWEFKTVKLGVGNFSSPNFELLEVDKFISQFGEQGWELTSTVGIVSFEITYPIQKKWYYFSNVN